MTEPVIAGDDFSVFLDPFFFTFPTANENSLAQDYSKATFREVAENEDDAEVEPLKNSFSALKDQLMILDTCRSDVLKLPVIGWLSSTSPFDTEIARVFLVLDMSFTIGGDVERLFTAIKKMNPDETHSPELQEMWTGLNLSLHRRLRTIYDSEGNSTIVSKYYICFAALVKACGQYSFHLAFALIALTLIPAIILASLELDETNS